MMERVDSRRSFQQIGPVRSSALSCSNQLLLVTLVALGCGFGPSGLAQPSTQPPAQFGAVGQRSGLGNPVLPGDHPDPTIIRVGHTYWMASTSGDWAPEFPLYKSKDMLHWKPQGAVFPATPEWAEADFWAPEMVSDEGRIFVFYVARQRNGPLCVAVATSSRPEGPYSDHGPIVCQQDGSIDPSFVRDESGQPFLVWKEDGNSQGKPTPIWAQPLTADLLHLAGSPTQLLVNDPESWEGGVVEAPYILRHDGHFYLFYAGNACCGDECRYAEGVARADHLVGPWEKDPANPVIAPNGRWKCPGHGTVVQTPKGRDYLLYHAYPAVGASYLGRESILDEVSWAVDGWPSINSGTGPSGDSAAGSKTAIVDKFRKPVLDPEWRWPVGQPTAFHAKGGKLVLEANPDGTPVYLERPLNSTSYVAEVGVEAEGDASGGLGVDGTHRSKRVIMRTARDVELYSVESGTRTMLWQTPVASASVVWFRISRSEDAQPIFEFSLDHKHWSAAPPADGAIVEPPLGQGDHVFLSVEGSAGNHAAFTRFSLLAEGEIAAATH